MELAIELTRQERAVGERPFGINGTLYVVKVDDRLRERASCQPDRRDCRECSFHGPVFLSIDSCNVPFNLPTTPPTLPFET